MTRPLYMTLARWIIPIGVALNPPPISQDSSNLLKLGLRLRHLLNSFDKKNPIMLPHHHISELIATHDHLQSLYGFQQLTLHTLRQRYWILGVCSLVKRLTEGCLECTRARAALSQQLVGDLSEFRLTPHRPFTHSSVDYASLYDVRFDSGRGRQSCKTYVALFVCCFTRAVYLELVSDYLSDAFLAAFQRFSSRLDANLHYEARVKSFKNHLKSIVGEHTLIDEEYYNLLTRLDACLNSRPIVSLSNEPEDFFYFTAVHFLIGIPLTNIPEQRMVQKRANSCDRCYRSCET
ncbi:uncharacterized protein LOC117173879 [Belonocnema kinseyi]|uniref:uncharacterized protein LOC117173879 n=1 Tax=Belonocnema kinseyi TaxID=2817044 RepID=UPI00143DCDAB|nr:uncharacterized protein LOC117173879 [Belonocnema kinseyi]